MMGKMEMAIEMGLARETEMGRDMEMKRGRRR